MPQPQCWGCTESCVRLKVQLTWRARHNRCDACSPVCMFKAANNLILQLCISAAWTNGSVGRCRVLLGRGMV